MRRTPLISQMTRVWGASSCALIEGCPLGSIAPVHLRDRPLDSGTACTPEASAPRQKGTTVSHDPTPAPLDAERIVSRRSVTAAAAWTVPVVAVAVATPSAAASTIDVGAFQLTGTCGTLGLGLLSTGFNLTAGPTALPTGTTIVVVGGGLANIGALTTSGSLAAVNVVSPTTRSIVLTGPLAAGATLALRTTINVSLGWSLSASVTVPTGYTATGAKAAATTSGTLVLCSAT